MLDRELELNYKLDQLKLKSIKSIKFFKIKN